MSFCVIRSLARAGIIYQKNVRCLSSSPKLVDVQVNEKTGISTVTMQRPPVNALNLELFKELYSVFTDLESDKSRGVILTSVSFTRDFFVTVYNSYTFLFSRLPQVYSVQGSIF